jgi:hypothetical protein
LDYKLLTFRIKVIKLLGRMHTRNQFEERFEDSEANFSEAGAGIASERGQGRPIQLLKVHPSGKI